MISTVLVSFYYFLPALIGIVASWVVIRRDYRPVEDTGGEGVNR